MNNNVKGAAVPVLVIVVAAVAVAAAGGFIGGVIYANHKKGGLGDNKAPGLSQETEPPAISETITASIEPETTEPLTEPVTNLLHTIEIAVSGNHYIYNGMELSLDELVGILRVNAELPVTVSDENASLKAYNDLITKLEALDIKYQIEG